MRWVEKLEDFTSEQQEIRTHQQMVRFVLREEFNLVGVELATSQAHIPHFALMATIHRLAPNA